MTRRANKQKGGDELELLAALQDDLNKRFGPDAAAPLTAQETLSRIDHWVTSRSIVVDSVLRGLRPAPSSLIPFGRQVELSGPENSGKTTLTAQIAAETQSRGGLVMVFDTEERIDEPYWQKLGVNTSRVLNVPSNSLDEIFDKQYAALDFAKSQAPDRLILLIWDSLGGTSGADVVDRKSKESPMEQAAKFNMRKAKKIADGIVLINSIVTDTRACYLYTNHEYTDINVKYGDNRQTHGGKKPKYFATVRLRLTPVGKIKEPDLSGGQDQVIGQRVRVKALKNSMSGTLLERDAVIMAGRGFVNEYTVMEQAEKMGLCKTSGSWSTWITPQGEEVKWQGWRGFEQKVVTHEDYESLQEAVLAGM